MHYVYEPVNPDLSSYFIVAFVGVSTKEEGKSNVDGNKQEGNEVFFHVSPPPK